MCHSFKESIRSYLFSNILSIYRILTTTNEFDIVLSLLIMTFSLIQLFEGLIWLDIDNKKDINRKITKLLKPTLLLKPITCSISTSYVLYINTYSYLNLIFINFICVLSILNFINYIIKVKDENKISFIGPNKHLIWNEENTQLTKYTLCGINCQYIYAVTSIVPILVFLNPIYKRIIYCSFYLITFLFSEYFYVKSHESSSYWCWVCNFSAFFLFL